MGDPSHLDESDRDKNVAILWTPSSVKVMKKGVRDGQRLLDWGLCNSGKRKRMISIIWIERVERLNERFPLFVG